MDRELVDLGRHAHGDATAADASGRTLVVGSPTVLRAPSVTEMVHWDTATPMPTGPWDTVVSLCHLWSIPDLGALLQTLAAGMDTHTLLLFCEPTGDAGAATGPPHDITGDYWAAGISVTNSQRFLVKQGRASQMFVRGVARLQRELPAGSNASKS